MLLHALNTTACYAVAFYTLWVLASVVAWVSHLGQRLQWLAPFLAGGAGPGAREVRKKVNVSSRPSREAFCLTLSCVTSIQALPVLPFLLVNVPLALVFVIPHSLLRPALLERVLSWASTFPGAVVMLWPGAADCGSRRGLSAHYYFNFEHFSRVWSWSWPQAQQGLRNGQTSPRACVKMKRRANAGTRAGTQTVSAYARLCYASLCSAVPLHLFLARFRPLDSPVVLTLPLPELVHDALSLGCLVFAFVVLVLDERTWTLIGVRRALAVTSKKSGLQEGSVRTLIVF